MPSYDPLDADSDPFRPPAVSTLVKCLHCGEEYDSYRIEWRIEQLGDGQPHGFWCCPIAECSGRGFGFDILPVDPHYQDEYGGWIWTDDEGEESEESFDADWQEDERPGGEEDLPR
jgi:hypothetical protein